MSEVVPASPEYVRISGLAKEVLQAAVNLSKESNVPIDKVRFTIGGGPPPFDKEPLIWVGDYSFPLDNPSS